MTKRLFENNPNEENWCLGNWQGATDTLILKGRQQRDKMHVNFSAKFFIFSKEKSITCDKAHTMYGSIKS